MFERFTKDARAAVVAAVNEAEAAGQRTVEAEHLLQGVLAAERGRLPRALRLAGVDVAQLRSRS
jgi:ATP-dependent Clp protease ATP-binding subunit ClpA